MRLALALACLLAHAAVANASVLVVGDSLVVGTAPYLPGRVTSDGRVGRPSTEAVSVLRAKFTGQDVVVFDAGVNDDPAQPSRLSNDLAAARSITGSRCLVVATMSRPPYNGVSVDGLNRAVRSFAGSAPNVQLVDWRGFAVGNPRLINSDGVHPTTAGYQLRARLFGQAIADCGQPASVAPPPATRPRPRPKPKPKAEPKPKPKPPPPELGNEVILDEPVEFGELVSPASKGSHPAVLMINGNREQAESLAGHGVAALLLEKGDARAAITMMRGRKDIKAIGVWGFGDDAARVAAGNPDVKAVMLVSPSPIPEATRDEWQIKHALDIGGASAGTAPISRFYALSRDQPSSWPTLSQPVLAVWGSADRTIPIHDSAEALAKAVKTAEFRTFPGASHELGVESESNRLGSAPGFKELSAQWLRDHLDGTPAPLTSTPLPPESETPVEDSQSFLEHWPVQLAWLLIPLLVAIRWRPSWMRFGVIVGLDLLALAAIAIAVAAIIDDGGLSVSAIAGVPTVILVAWVFTLVAAGATAVLARTRAIAMASSAWLLLALFWLV